MPNRRDHGLLSQIGPESFANSLCRLKKKHFYTGCAGLSVYVRSLQYTVYLARFRTYKMPYYPEGRPVPFLVNFKKSRHLGFGVSVVIWSMCCLFLVSGNRHLEGSDQPDDGGEMEGGGEEGDHRGGVEEDLQNHGQVRREIC